ALAISTDSSIVFGPSSNPGKMWQCKSIIGVRAYRSLSVFIFAYPGAEYQYPGMRP
ncbi:MAG: hypothetical protein QOG55_564, partial [Acidobacteriaceae bacterium]|nr:hypothetical protein [Acidobacteriaceae bacterium]